MFSGRPVYGDADPDGTGAALFRARRTAFRRSTQAMLLTVIDAHAGWDTLLGDWLAAGDGGDPPCRVCGGPQAAIPQRFSLRSARHAGGHDYAPSGPRCRCAGACRSGIASMLPRQLSERADIPDAVWVYAFLPNGRQLLVLGNRGYPGMGFGFGRWRIAADIDLDGPEPDWAAVAATQGASGLPQVPRTPTMAT
jgi:hypothetical protein